MISSMSLQICNRFQATRENSGKITTCRFLKNVRSMLKNVMRKMSRYISSHFVAIQC